MANVKVGEVGRVIYFGAGFDLSGASSLTGKLISPSGVEKSVSATLGVVNFGSYLANQYATYTTQAGDLDVAGTWTACLEYADPTPKLYKSDSDTFVVDAAC